MYYMYLHGIIPQTILDIDDKAHSWQYSIFVIDNNAKASIG